jgi:hypothetical protein
LVRVVSCTDGVGEGVGLLHGVGGEDDDATLLGTLDDVPHLAARHRIHARRLMETISNNIC